MRLISCAYCGRMHPAGVICDKKPKRKEKRADTTAVHIRNSSLWQRTREHIKQRDNNLCQLCLRGYPGTKRRVEYEHLSVHHIVALEDDETKAFDYNNLITLCEVHHEAAESGLVSKADLIKIVEELENGSAANPSLSKDTPGL